MPQPPGDARPGDAPSAADRNRLLASLRDAASLRGGPGVSARDSRGGRSLAGRPEGEHSRIKLTGSFSSGYPWKEVVRSGGAWLDTGRVGSSASDPAFELNDDISLPASATIYPARRAAGGDWVFWRPTAGGGGPPPDTCLCWEIGSTPETLSWTAVWEAAEAADPDTGDVAWTEIGTASGTLSWMEPVAYDDYTGTDTCLPGELSAATVPGGYVGGGWIGEWTDYCFLEGPGDVSTGTAIHRPHCVPVNLAVCSGSSGPVCRWLMFLCTAIDVDIGGSTGHAVIGKSSPGSGPLPAVRCDSEVLLEGDSTILTCDPFYYETIWLVSGTLRYTLTITE